MTVNQPTPNTGNKNKWIWIGLGAALLFCCGAALVAVLVFGAAGRRLQQGIKTDPESAAKAAHEIADYDLPDGYQEKMAMDLVLYSFVMIAPESIQANGSLIMLAQFDQTYGADSEQMEQQLRKSFEEQSGNSSANMKLVEARDATIRGEKTVVAVYEGTDENGITMRQLITSFPAKNGSAMLMIVGDAEHWDQQLADDFIESIR